jgi:undecaprenyl diphosphate synthase
MNSLQHIAFIMDGNRRWAKKRGLPIAAGHRQGAETLTNIAKAAKKMGLKYMTVYAFSTENWQREKSEVDGLMNLLRQYLDNGFKELQENNARIIFIGEREMLAADIQAKMAKIESESAKNSDVTLCVALSYGGRQEITAAARKLAQRVKEGLLEPSEITPQIMGDALYTAGIPDPDLLIRTSGEERLSNFLPWQSAYTELYFSETLWPDFSAAELEDIIKKYELRERRYGQS